MKKMNNKGFTIVELVIVIAVIAILAAVMIPTFSGIVEKANLSALEQKVSAGYKEAMSEDLADDGIYNNSFGLKTTDANYGKAYKATNDFTYLFTVNGDGDCEVTFNGTYHTKTGASIADGKITLK